jgi:hypothetical protein
MGAPGQCAVRDVDALRDQVDCSAGDWEHFGQSNRASGLDNAVTCSTAKLLGLN